MERSTQKLLAITHMLYKNLEVEPWEDYELLDSGDNRKLERFGKFILIRPETQAIWEPAHPELWKSADSEFLWKEGKGMWRGKKLPEKWIINRKGIHFQIKLTSFKHTGIFPEQAANWDWIMNQCRKLNQPEVLNLFAYTGAASIAAAKAGARVTHVDASKQSNSWAKTNADLSGIESSQIRYLLEDAAKFVSREAKRGKKYDGIILDPPAFGRGPKGEVWKIEEQISPLLFSIEKILKKSERNFLLLNGYAAGYSPWSFLQGVKNAFKNMGEGEFGELHLTQKKTGIVLPSGIYVRFVR